MERARDFVRDHVIPRPNGLPYPYYAFCSESIGWAIGEYIKRKRLPDEDDSYYNSAVVTAMLAAGYKPVYNEDVAFFFEIDFRDIPTPKVLTYVDLGPQSAGRPIRSSGFSEQRGCWHVLNGEAGTKFAKRPSSFIRNPSTPLPPKKSRAQQDLAGRLPRPVHAPSVTALRNLDYQTARGSLTIPVLERVLIGMAWLVEFAAPASRFVDLNKAMAESWAGRYLTQAEMMVAATVLGFEVTRRRDAKWKFRDLRLAGRNGHELRHAARLPANSFDPAEQHRRFVQLLGRPEIVPYGEWWPSATSAEIAEASRLGREDQWT